MIIVNYEPIDHQHLSRLRSKNHDLYYLNKQAINVNPDHELTHEELDLFARRIIRTAEPNDVSPLQKKVFLLLDPDFDVIKLLNQYHVGVTFINPTVKYATAHHFSLAKRKEYLAQIAQLDSLNRRLTVDAPAFDLNEIIQQLTNQDETTYIHNTALHRFKILTAENFSRRLFKLMQHSFGPLTLLDIRHTKKPVKVEIDINRANPTGENNYMTQVKITTYHRLRIYEQDVHTLYGKLFDAFYDDEPDFKLTLGHIILDKFTAKTGGGADE